jgi:hypothetical protein
MEYVLLIIAFVFGVITVGCIIMAVRIKPDWPKDKSKRKLWKPPTPKT